MAKEGAFGEPRPDYAFAWDARRDLPTFVDEFVAFHDQARRDWSPGKWSLLLGVWADGEAAGVQEVRAVDFAVQRTVTTGSWIARRFQRRGIGREMRLAVLALAFDGLGARLAESRAAHGNEASIAISLGLGYERGPEVALRDFNPRAPEGLRGHRYWISDQQWRSRERPAVRLTGLDGCRELFGAH